MKMGFETTLGKWLARVARNCLLGAAAILAASGMTSALAQSKPALVRDVDNGAMQPVQLVATINVLVSVFSMATNLDGSAFTVPAGKRLVVEYVSADANIESPGVAMWVDLILVEGGVLGHPVVRVPLVYGGTIGNVVGLNLYSGGAMVRAYFNAGRSVRAYCNTSQVDSGASCSVSITGYLVDLP